MNLGDLYSNKNKTASADVTKNIQNEITSMQFYELDYKEANGFFSNLRCTLIWLFGLVFIWMITLIYWCLIKKNKIKI